jgi:hypothetical protein
LEQHIDMGPVVAQYRMGRVGGENDISIQRDACPYQGVSRECWCGRPPTASSVPE